MKMLKRFVVTVTAALCLLTPIWVMPALADTQSTAIHADSISTGDDLISRINDTYKRAKKSAHTKSFKGKCGKYVNRQLVVLGINKSYIGCNGNKAYDVYAKKSRTSGGYKITAYSAKKYSLKSALEAIEKSDPHARNILVGFQKGTSKAGKKYGHVLFIHGIENGDVYFSDSFSQKVDGVRYKEGAAIVCSIATFTQLYKKYKLDGVIHFG